MSKNAGAAAPRFYPTRRRLQPRQPQQLSLTLPRPPKESPLRDAFRRAELARVGLEFKAVHGHPQGAWLLRKLADAYGRCDDHAIRLHTGFLIRMRSKFKREVRA